MHFSGIYRRVSRAVLSIFSIKIWSNFDNIGRPTGVNSLAEEVHTQHMHKLSQRTLIFCLPHRDKRKTRVFKNGKYFHVNFM